MFQKRKDVKLLNNVIMVMHFNSNKPPFYFKPHPCFDMDVVLLSLWHLLAVCGVVNPTNNPSVDPLKHWHQMDQQQDESLQ